MKTLSTTLCVLLCSILLNAQPPQAFKYQAVARDNAGNVLANQNVSFQISILQEESSTSTIVVYTETHDKTTNEFGLVNLEIGNGAAVPSGSYFSW